MAGRRSRTTARARQMRRVLGQWERSGLTLTEFARRHGLAASTLTWWRRVFRDAEGQPAATSAGQRRWAGRHASSPRRSREGAFSEVRLTPPAPLTPPVWEIGLRSGHVLRVPPASDAAALRAVVAVLESSGC
jgi:transposase-like protein